jgi:hypothetical protein
LSRERGLDWDSRRSSSTSGWTQQQTANGSSHAKRDFLEARQVSLYELFDGNAFLLDVPEYQRPYAWRAKQVCNHGSTLFGLASETSTTRPTSKMHHHLASSSSDAHASGPYTAQATCCHLGRVINQPQGSNHHRHPNQHHACQQPTITITIISSSYLSPAAVTFPSPRPLEPCVRHTTLHSMPTHLSGCAGARVAE